MKTIKYLLLLIIAIFIAALIFFNKEYFMTGTALSIHVQDFTYTLPEFPTIAYIGICFLLGLALSGMSAISIRLCMGRTLKEKETFINKLTGQIDILETELNVFKHDPYIKKGLEAKAGQNNSKDTGPVVLPGNEESDPGKKAPQTPPVMDEETVDKGLETGIQDGTEPVLESDSDSTENKNTSILE